MRRVLHVETPHGFVKTVGQGDRLGGPVGYKTGELMGFLELLTCPGRTAKETASLSVRIAAAGWHTSADDVLALVVGQYLVYANFRVYDYGDSCGSL